MLFLYGVGILDRSYTFFGYFKTLRLKIYSNIVSFENFKTSTFFIEKY